MSYNHGFPIHGQGSVLCWIQRFILLSEHQLSSSYISSESILTETSSNLLLASRSWFSDVVKNSWLLPSAWWLCRFHRWPCQSWQKPNCSSNKGYFRRHLGPLSSGWPSIFCSRRFNPSHLCGIKGRIAQETNQLDKELRQNDIHLLIPCWHLISLCWK